MKIKKIKINSYGKLKNKEINLENNLNIIYPGSMISLGFDELGDHGMVAGEINFTENKLEFIKLDETEFVELEIKCTEINSV